MIKSVALLALAAACGSGASAAAPKIVATRYLDALCFSPDKEFLAPGLANREFGYPRSTGQYGFRFDPDAKWQGLVGDFDGDGLDDIATINNIGELYTAKNKSDETFGPIVKTSAGWRFDLDAGWRAFPGDFNGDSKTDLVQITQYGDRVWVSLSNNGVLPNPSPAGQLGFLYNPATGYWIGVGDVNGDGRDDLIQNTPFRDAWVALANASGTFDAPTKWGVTGFAWNYGHTSIVTGDFDGDGKADLAYSTLRDINGPGQLWVALSTGEGFAVPSLWATTSLQTIGYFTPQNAFDWNGDGKADLLEVAVDTNSSIEVVTSTGSAFNEPESVGPINLHFPMNYIDGNGPTFFGNFSDVVHANKAAGQLPVTSSPVSSHPIQPTPTPSLTPTPAER